MPDYINLVLQDALASLIMILRILAFAVPFSASALILLPPEDRMRILGEDRDGRRMFLFGIAISIAMILGPSSIAIVVIASTVAYWIAKGALIWMNDNWTKKLLKPTMLAIYIPMGLIAFYFGAGYGSFGFSPSANTYGFTELLAPALLVTLLVNLGIFAGLLTDRFNARILPQNNLGFRYMGLAGGLLLLALFNTNPIAMLALAVFSMNAFCFGALIALPEPVTKFLVHDNMAIPWVLITGLAFFKFLW